MNDLTPTERTVLATRLGDAVPESPDLTDLVPRAEAQARRVRRTRRLGAGVAAAMVVAAVVTVPRLVGRETPPAHPEPAPARCVPQAKLDHRDFATGTAVWVKACPSGDASSEIPLPSGAIRGFQATALVHGWQRFVRPPQFVSGPSATYPGVTVQVGFADGTTAEVRVGGNNSVVEPSGQELGGIDGPVGFADEVAQRLQQANAAHASSTTRAMSVCPPTTSGLGRLAFHGSTAHLAPARAHARALLDLPAESALLCSYEGGRLRQGERALTAAAEGLLLSSASGWYLWNPKRLHNLAWDEGRAHPSTYAVWLQDADGNEAAFTVTGRLGRVTFYWPGGTVVRHGMASRPLLQALGSDR